MSRPTFAACVAVFLSTSLPIAFAASEPTSKQFVKDAIEDNLAEIKASELALTRSDNPAVKAFAQRMIDDHTKSNTKLETAAARYDIKVPDNSSKMDNDLKSLASDTLPTLEQHEHSAMQLASSEDTANKH